MPGISKRKGASTDEQTENDINQNSKSTNSQIRLLEEKDCEYLVHKLIYENTFYENAKLIAGNSVQGKWFIAFVAATSFLVYHHTESMIHANIWFFTAVIFVYLFMMYFVCYRNMYLGDDIQKSSAQAFYNFWSDHDEGRYMWVAIQDHVLIGSAGVMPSKEENCATVTRVVVKPNARRQRIATQLMLTLLDDCVVRNIEKLEAAVTFKQLAAQKLFKKFGFRTSLKGFFRFGLPPFFTVRSAKYSLSLEKVE